MRNLVIIAGSCFPQSSATGRIAIQCSEYLKSEYDISFVVIQEENNKYCGDIINGVSVYTLSQLRLKWAQICEKKIKEGKRVRYYSVLLFLLRAIGRIQSLILTIDNNWWFQRKAYKMLEEINKKHKIDAILSFSAPIESHLSAYRFKRKYNVKWVSFWADLFTSERFKINFFWNMNRMLKLEKKLLDFSDYILTTEEIYQILKCRCINDTISYVPYTINERILAKDCKKQVGGTNINFVYMGSFYRKIRNPEYMLNVFERLAQDINICLDIYSTGDCNDIISKYVKRNMNSIVAHDTVSTEELEKILGDSDILINIENQEANTVPSKIFELLAYRKPIIDFGYHNSANLLDQYPLALCVCMEDSVEETAKKIKSFIKYKESVITAEKIKSLYPMNTEEIAHERILKALN